MVDKMLRMNLALLCIYYLVFAIVISLLTLPFTVSAVAAGFIFSDRLGVFVGVILGASLCWLSMLVTGVIAFLATRATLGPAQETVKLHYILVALDRAFESQGIRLNVLLRLCPVMPTGWFNYAMGLVPRCSFQDYLMGTMIGNAPWAIVLTYFGTALTSFSGDATLTTTQEAWIYGVGVPVGLLACAALLHYTKAEVDKMVEQSEALGPGSSAGEEPDSGGRVGENEMGGRADRTYGGP